MFKQIFAMIAQAALMLTNLFAAGTKLSNAAVHTAAFVEGAAEGFNEIASLERNEKLEALRGKYDINTRIRAVESQLAASDAESKLKLLRAEASNTAAA
ncbi:hypothetical protein HOT57_gp25 [Pseudomonas phage phCDa]|uniref:Uncharacterized protein n=1 Tax=Pseudomonas phage phCDa TaxID=2268587 RepID=A0A2Z5H8Y2_9CAUD|nr:hypothetical protein HOT57_gp25 [Pseudomonas phage phCDa]AXC36469.1 hypothetical protein phCDa_25 [Pseudomonas phage phCDa]